MNAKQIEKSEYHPYYQAYIDKSSSGNVIYGLEQNLKIMLAFYKTIPKSLHNYAYADGKWSIKDIILHINDTERIFAYRALRIARGDQTDLAGFEQDDYVISGNAALRSMESLVEDYMTIRKASITLFKGFGPKEMIRTGSASGSKISVRAIGHILTGHENHHSQVIKSRYLCL